MSDSARKLENVFWLGGSPCVGKSSISKIIASRFDLDVYCVDEAFAIHAQRFDPIRHGSNEVVGVFVESALDATG